MAFSTIKMPYEPPSRDPKVQTIQAKSNFKWPLHCFWWQWPSHNHLQQWLQGNGHIVVCKFCLHIVIGNVSCHIVIGGRFLATVFGFLFFSEPMPNYSILWRKKQVCCSKQMIDLIDEANWSFSSILHTNGLIKCSFWYIYSYSLLTQLPYLPPAYIVGHYNIVALHGRGPCHDTFVIALWNSEDHPRQYKQVIVYLNPLLLNSILWLLQGTYGNKKKPYGPASTVALLPLPT